MQVQPSANLLHALSALRGPGGPAASNGTSGTGSRSGFAGALAQSSTVERKGTEISAEASDVTPADAPTTSQPTAATPVRTARARGHLGQYLDIRV